MKKGKIYRIIHLHSDKQYIGSTMNELRWRWQQHKNTYKYNKDSLPSLYKYFKLYGIKNFKILLIKEYNVIDRKHLFMYEQLWINKLKCINMQNAFIPLPKKIYNKINYKKYNKINKKKKKTDDYRNKINLFINNGKIIHMCNNMYIEEMIDN